MSRLIWEAEFSIRGHGVIDKYVLFAGWEVLYNEKNTCEWGLE